MRIFFLSLSPFFLLCFFGCNQQEREHYEYLVVEGKLVHKQTGNLLDTTKGKPGAKWIFVMSTSKRLYAGEVRMNKQNDVLPNS